MTMAVRLLTIKMKDRESNIDLEERRVVQDPMRLDETAKDDLLLGRPRGGD